MTEYLGFEHVPTSEGGILYPRRPAEPPTPIRCSNAAPNDVDEHDYNTRPRLQFRLSDLRGSVLAGR